MNDEQTCKQAYDDFYHKIKAEVCYDHWCSIWRFISKRQARGEPVAWHSKQYGVVWMAIKPGNLVTGTQWFIQGRQDPVAEVISPVSLVWHVATSELEHGTVFYTAPQPQPHQHPDDIAVDAFATGIKAKLAKKRAEGRGGWQECDAGYLSELLRGHVEKGDPVDVANLAMMLHQNGQIIQPAPQPQQRASEPVGEVFTMEPLDGSGDVKCHALLTKQLPSGTKLYAAPEPKEEP